MPFVFVVLREAWESQTGHAVATTKRFLPSAPIRYSGQINDGLLSFPWGPSHVLCTSKQDSSRASVPPKQTSLAWKVAARSQAQKGWGGHDQLPSSFSIRAALRATDPSLRTLLALGGAPTSCCPQNLPPRLRYPQRDSAHRQPRFLKKRVCGVRDRPRQLVPLDRLSWDPEVAHRTSVPGLCHL